MTYHEALWKVSRANILLMMADRSNFKYQKEKVIQASGADLSKKFKKTQ